MNKTPFLALAIALANSSAFAALPATPLHRLSAEETAKLICNKQVSSEEVVRYWLDRVDAHPELNAFI